MTFPQIRTNSNNSVRSVNQDLTPTIALAFTTPTSEITSEMLKDIAKESQKDYHAYQELLVRKPDLASKLITNPEALYFLCESLGRGTTRAARFGFTFQLLSREGKETAVGCLARNLLANVSKTLVIPPSSSNRRPKKISGSLRARIILKAFDEGREAEQPYFGQRLREEFLVLKPVLPTTVFYSNTLFNTPAEAIKFIDSSDDLPTIIIMNDSGVINIGLLLDQKNFVRIPLKNPTSSITTTLQELNKKKLDLNQINKVFSNEEFCKFVELFLSTESENLLALEQKNNSSIPNLKQKQERTSAFLNILDTAGYGSNFFYEWCLRHALTSLGTPQNFDEDRKAAVKNRINKLLFIGTSVDDINITSEQVKFVFGAKDSLSLATSQQDSFPAEKLEALMNTQVECIVEFLLTTSNPKAWSFFLGDKSSDVIGYKSNKERKILIGLLFERVLSDAESFELEIIKQASKFLQSQINALRDSLGNERENDVDYIEFKNKREELVRKISTSGESSDEINRMDHSISRNFLGQEDLLRQTSFSEPVATLDSLRLIIQPQLNEVQGNDNRILEILEKYNPDLTFIIWMNWDVESSFEKKIAMWRKLSGNASQLESDAAITGQVVAQTLENTILPCPTYLWDLVKEYYKNDKPKQQALVNQFHEDSTVLKESTIDQVISLLLEWNFEISQHVIHDLFTAKKRGIQLLRSQNSTTSIHSLESNASGRIEEDPLSSSIDSDQTSSNSIVLSHGASLSQSSPNYSHLLQAFLKRTLSSNELTVDIFPLLKNFPAGIEDAVKLLLNVVNDKNIDNRTNNISCLIEILEASDLSSVEVKTIFEQAKIVLTDKTLLRDFLKKALLLDANHCFEVMKKLPMGFEEAVKVLLTEVMAINHSDIHQRTQNISRLIKALEKSTLSSNDIESICKQVKLALPLPENSILSYPTHTNFNNIFPITRLLIVSMLNDQAAQSAPEDFFFSILVKNINVDNQNSKINLLSDIKVVISNSSSSNFKKRLFEYLLKNLASPGCLDVVVPLLTTFLIDGLVGKKSAELEKIISVPLSNLRDLNDRLFVQLYTSILSLVQSDTNSVKQLFKSAFLEQVKSGAGEKNEKLLWILNRQSVSFQYEVLISLFEEKNLDPILASQLLDEIQDKFSETQKVELLKTFINRNPSGNYVDYDAKPVIKAFEQLSQHSLEILARDLAHAETSPEWEKIRKDLVALKTKADDIKWLSLLSAEEKQTVLIAWLENNQSEKVIIEKGLATLELSVQIELRKSLSEPAKKKLIEALLSNPQFYETEQEGFLFYNNEFEEYVKENAYQSIVFAQIINNLNVEKDLRDRVLLRVLRLVKSETKMANKRDDLLAVGYIKSLFGSLDHLFELMQLERNIIVFEGLVAPPPPQSPSRSTKPVNESPVILAVEVLKHLFSRAIISGCKQSVILNGYAKKYVKKFDFWISLYDSVTFTPSNEKTIFNTLKSIFNNLELADKIALLNGVSGITDSDYHQKIFRIYLTAINIQDSKLFTKVCKIIGDFYFEGLSCEEIKAQQILPILNILTELRISPTRYVQVIEHFLAIQKCDEEVLFHQSSFDSIANIANKDEQEAIENVFFPILIKLKNTSVTEVDARHVYFISLINSNAENLKAKLAQYLKVGEHTQEAAGRGGEIVAELYKQSPSPNIATFVDVYGSNEDKINFLKRILQKLLSATPVTITTEITKLLRGTKDHLSSIPAELDDTQKFDFLSILAKEKILQEVSNEQEKVGFLKVLLNKLLPAESLDTEIIELLRSTKDHLSSISEELDDAQKFDLLSILAKKKILHEVSNEQEKIGFLKVLLNKLLPGESLDTEIIELLRSTKDHLSSISAELDDAQKFALLSIVVKQKILHEVSNEQEKVGFLKVLLKKLLPGKSLDTEITELLRSTKDHLSKILVDLDDAQKVSLIDICKKESLLDKLSGEEFANVLASIESAKEKTNLCKALLLSSYFSRAHVIVLMKGLEVTDQKEQKDLKNQIAIFDQLTGRGTFPDKMKEKLRYVVYVLLGNQETRAKLREPGSLGENNKTRLERWIEIERTKTESPEEILAEDSAKNQTPAERADEKALNNISKDVDVIRLVSQNRIEFAGIKDLASGVESLLSEVWDHLIENLNLLDALHSASSLGCDHLLMSETAEFNKIPEKLISGYVFRKKGDKIELFYYNKTENSGTPLKLEFQQKSESADKQNDFDDFLREIYEKIGQESEKIIQLSDNNLQKITLFTGHPPSLKNLPPESQIHLLQLLDAKLAEQNNREAKRKEALSKGEAALRLTEELSKDVYKFERQPNSRNQTYIAFYNTAMRSIESKSLYLYKTSNTQVTAIKINGDDVFETTFPLNEIDFNNNQQILDKVVEEEKKALKAEGLLLEEPAMSREELEKVIEESRKVFGDTTGSELYKLCESIKPLYESALEAVFNDKSIEFCLENLPKFSVLLMSNSQNKPYSLIDARIQILLAELVDSDSDASLKKKEWLDWVSLFSQLETKSKELTPFLNVSLVEGLKLLDNMEEALLLNRLKDIPSSALDWLMHRIEGSLAQLESIEQDGSIDVEKRFLVRNTLIFEYILRLCKNEITLEKDDSILENIANTGPESREAIYKAIKSYLSTNKVGEVPEAVCTVMLYHFFEDQTEDFSVFKALMKLPEKLDEKTVEDWKTNIDSTLRMLDFSKHKEGVIALFKELFKYYSEGKIVFDVNGVVSDALAETIYTIHSFTSSPINILLEKCDPKTKNELLGRSLGSISSFRRIHTLNKKSDIPVSTDPAEISEDKRENWFGGALLAGIPNTARALSFGDTWHILKVESKDHPLAIVGHCLNAHADRANSSYPEEIIEFFVKLPQDEKDSLEVYLWNRGSGNSRYEKVADAKLYLGEKTIKGLQETTESMRQAIKSGEDKFVAVQNTIGQVFEDPCQARSIRANALLTGLTADNAAVNQDMYDTFKTYGAFHKIHSVLAAKITNNISQNPSPKLADADQDKVLCKFQEDFVWLKKSVADPQLISELKTKEDFSNIVNALRERVVFAIAYAKKVNQDNQRKFAQEKALFEKEREKRLKEFEDSPLNNRGENKHPVYQSWQKVVVEVGKDVATEQPIYKTYIVSVVKKNEEETLKKELSNVKTLEELDKLVSANRITKQEPEPLPLFVHPEKSTGRFVELYEPVFAQGRSTFRISQVWVPKESEGVSDPERKKAISQLNTFLSIKDLSTTDQAINSATIALYSRYLQISNRLQNAQWNIQRAENFPIDDWMKLEINELRENIRALKLKGGPAAQLAAEHAETVLSAYIGESDAYERKKSAIGSCFKYLTKQIVGSEIDQYVSMWSAYLPKRKFDLGKVWNSERTGIAPNTELYVFKEGEPVLVGKVTDSFKLESDGKCRHQIQWLECTDSYEYYALEYKRKLKNNEIEVVRNKILEREEEAAEQGAPRVDYFEKNQLLTDIRSTLEIELREIDELMATKAAGRILPSREQLPYQSNQTLYTKDGHCLGIVDEEFSLEQDLLFDKTMWFDTLLNLSHKQLVSMGEPTSIVAILDVINQGLLTKFYEAVAERKTYKEAELLKQKVLDTFLSQLAVKPVLSADDCQEIIKQYEPKDIIQIFEQYTKSNDKKGKTRQELLKGMMSSARVLPYFFSTTDRSMQFWKYLNDSQFKVETIVEWLNAWKDSNHPYKNKVTQFLIATGLKNLPVQEDLIGQLRLEELPLDVIKDLPKEVRIALLLSPQNFSCRIKVQYFDALSEDFTKKDMRTAFTDFLKKGGIKQPNVEQGMIAFYRNMKSKGCEIDFWNIFGEFSGSNRQTWVIQTMFSNLGFMQALSEDVDQWNKKPPYARYSAFTMKEIVDLIRLYKVTASEDQARFLSDWLSKQLQNKEWRQENKKQCEQVVVAANDSVISKEEFQFIAEVVAMPSTSVDKNNFPIATTVAQEVPVVEAKLWEELETYDDKNLSELDSTTGEVILSLVGDEAFKKTFQKKFPGMASNLEALHTELLKKDAADLNELFYEKGKLVLDAANMPINLSFLATVKHQIWALKNIDYALLLSAHRLQEKDYRIDFSERKKWRKVLSDYIWTIDYIRHTEENNAKTLEQLLKVKDTLIILLDVKKEGKVSDVLITLLKKENFLLLMDLYNTPGSDVNVDKIKKQIEHIIGFMFLADPQYLFKELSAFDRKKEWDFVVRQLEANAILSQETEMQVTERVQNNADSRHVNTAAAAVGTLATATAVGMYTGHTLKFLFLGTVAAGVVAAVNEGLGLVYDASVTFFSWASNKVNAARLGISSQKLDIAKTIYQHRTFEEKSQKRKRSYGGTLERIRQYEKGQWILGGRLRAIGVRFGLWGTEPKSSYIDSYRLDIPNLKIIGLNEKLPASSAQGEIILKRCGHNKYTCLYGKTTLENVILSQTFLSQDRTLSISDLSESDRIDFIVMLESHIDPLRNKKILEEYKKEKETGYQQHSSKLEQQHKAVTTNRTLQEDLKAKDLAFSNLSDHLRLPTPAENVDKTKEQITTDAKALLRSMQAAIELANLSAGIGKVHVATNANYAVPSKWFAGCLARLYNRSGISWLRGDYLIEAKILQNLRNQLTELAVNNEKELVGNGTPTVALAVEGLLNNKVEGFIPAASDTVEKSDTLKNLSTIVTDTLKIWDDLLIKKLETSLKTEGGDLDIVLGDVASYLSTLIKTGMRIILLQENNESSRDNIQKIANRCEKIQNIIKDLKVTNKTALAQRMERMIYDIQYECSNVPQRLLLSRLDFLYNALPTDSRDLLVQTERENIRKEMIGCCAAILREYPEDKVVSEKLSKIKVDPAIDTWKHAANETILQKRPLVRAGNKSACMNDAPKINYNYGSKVEDVDAVLNRVRTFSTSSFCTVFGEDTPSSSRRPSFSVPIPRHSFSENKRH
jgi:hypothetical protein